MRWVGDLSEHHGLTSRTRMFLNKRSLKDTWPVFSIMNAKDMVLNPIWKLALLGALGFTAEAWSFQITTILT